MQFSRAFAPGNVSCVFKIIRDDNPHRMHSLGMGFTVREGVHASVEPTSEFQTIFNGERFDFATVRMAVQLLTDVPVKITLCTELPLSGGFGLSGASALAAVFATNQLLELGHDHDTLGMAAHVAEVQNLTGLGDVGGQYNGGCLAKFEVGQPLAAVALPVLEQDIYYRYFSPILTKEIIGDPHHAQLINQAAERALEILAQLRTAGECNFAEYIAVAKDFAEESKLMHDPQVLQAIAEAEAAGGAASMIMLGNAVFSTVAFEGATKTRLTRHKVSVVT